MISFLTGRAADVLQKYDAQKLPDVPPRPCCLPVLLIRKSGVFLGEQLAVKFLLAVYSLPYVWNRIRYRFFRRLSPW